MDSGELDLLAEEVGALQGALEAERFRNVAGIERDPALTPLFTARSHAAHRETVSVLRAAGKETLALRVAALRAERVAAGEEEAWRAAESVAVGRGPRGTEPLAALEASLPRERDPDTRALLARAAADALGEPASAREAWAEVRARARAEVGLPPDWDAVVAGDEALAVSDDGWKDLSAFALRRHPPGTGGTSRADLLHALAPARWDGLFHAGMLPTALRLTFEPLGLDLGAIRIDDAERPAKWPGAHGFGRHVSFRPRGGAGDWADLLAAAGRAIAAGVGMRGSSPRDPGLGEAFAWLLGSLLLEPRWLAGRADVEKRVVKDVVRDLALRRLFALRADAAALRVATEVLRGLSGSAWRQAHRDALAAATGASWDGVRASRDADASRLADRIRGAAEGERLRAGIRERFDEDWWRNPRTAGHLAGLLAAGRLQDAAPPPAAGAARMLVGRLEGEA